MKLIPLTCAGTGKILIVNLSTILYLYRDIEYPHTELVFIGGKAKCVKETVEEIQKLIEGVNEKQS